MPASHLLLTSPPSRIGSCLRLENHPKSTRPSRPCVGQSLQLSAKPIPAYLRFLSATLAQTLAFFWENSSGDVEQEARKCRKCLGNNTLGISPFPPQTRPTAHNVPVIRARHRGIQHERKVESNHTEDAQLNVSRSEVEDREQQRFYPARMRTRLDRACRGR